MGTVQKATTTSVTITQLLNVTARSFLRVHDAAFVQGDRFGFCEDLLKSGA